MRRFIAFPPCLLTAWSRPPEICTSPKPSKACQFDCEGLCDVCLSFDMIYYGDTPLPSFRRVLLLRHPFGSHFWPSSAPLFLPRRPLGRHLGRFSPRTFIDVEELPLEGETLRRAISCPPRTEETARTASGDVLSGAIEAA